MKKDLKATKLTLGQRIKSMRGDLTQVEFASMLGIKQAMISRYEANKETPSPKTLLTMARFTGKSMEWILTGQEELFKKAERPEGDVTKDDLIKIAGEDLLNTHDAAAHDFIEMMNDVFKNKKRMEKVIDFYRYLKMEG